MNRAPGQRRPTYAARILMALATVMLAVVLTPAPPAATDTTAAVRLAGVPRRATLDQDVAVTGTVADDGGRPVGAARVVVELSTRGGWVPTASTGVTARDGSFGLAAPTFFYGRHVFRVSAPDLGASSPAESVQVRLPYRPTGRASAFRLDATRFDPCTPIPFRVNLAGAPRNALALVRAALRKARAATGLTFTYAGTYDGVPFSRPGAGLPATGIGFAWATPRQVDGLSGAAIGLGGGGWSLEGRRLSAGVVVDRTFRLRPGWRRANSVGGLLLHEVGHALGLEHVTDRHQQMFPRNVGTRTGDYNRGDLAALRRVGLEGGCLGTDRGRDTRTARVVAREQLVEGGYPNFSTAVSTGQ